MFRWFFSSHSTTIPVDLYALAHRLKGESVYGNL